MERGRRRGERWRRWGEERREVEEVGGGGERWRRWGGGVEREERDGGGGGVERDDGEKEEKE